MKNLCTILLLVWACAPLKGYSPNPKVPINPDSLLLLITNPNLHASLIEEIAKSLEDKRPAYTPQQRLQLLTQLSFMQNYLGDIGNAQATLTKASAWLPQVQDSAVLYDYILTGAEIAINKGDFRDAVKTLEAVRIFSQKNQLSFLQKRALSKLGILYYLQGNPQQSLLYFKQSLQLAAAVPYPYLETSDFLSMGICYYSTHRDSAYLLSTLALQQALSRKDTFNAVMANLTLGQFHNMENNHTHWLNYVQAAVDLANRTRNYRLRLLANINLMDFSIASRDYQQTIKTGKVIKAMTSDMETEYLTDIYTDSLLYEAYLAMENYPSAIQHLNNYYSNTLKTKEKEYLSELVILQNQQEIQEKNLSIAQQRLQIQQQKKRFIVLLLSSLFIIVLLSSYIFFKNIHRKYSRNIFHKDRTIDKLLEVSAPGLPFAHTMPNSMQPHQHDPVQAAAETERLSLYHEFIALMENEKLYLNPQLDQKTLVSMLGTNKQYLYQAISQHEDANFKHILNRYRVNEAKKIMENYLAEYKSFSFDSIYLNAGFNSITSYYRAFKLITGLTPGEYMTELQHEINEKRMPNNTASDH